MEPEQKTPAQKFRWPIKWWHWLLFLVPGLFQAAGFQYTLNLVTSEIRPILNTGRWEDPVVQSAHGFFTRTLIQVGFDVSIVTALLCLAIAHFVFRPQGHLVKRLLATFLLSLPLAVFSFCVAYAGCATILR